MSGKIHVRHDGIRIKLAWLIAAAVAGGFGRGVWWLIRHPLVLVLVGAAVGGGLAAHIYGAGPVAGIAAGVAVVLLVWGLVHSTSFRRVVVWPLAAWVRRVFVYRPQWKPLMRMLELGLGEEKDDNEVLPELVSVRCQGVADRVVIRTLPGQVLADYAQHADRFAATFEATDCRVRSVTQTTLGMLLRRLVARFARLVPVLAARLPPAAPAKLRKRLVELWLLRSDPLAAPVPMLDVPAAEKLDLSRLPVAVTETGRPWFLRLLATHLLVVGATGAGKGSVLWSIIRALGNAIRTRLVELWVIDPKGGMEFARGQRLFARYCYGNTSDTTQDSSGPVSPVDREERASYEHAYADLLESAVGMMRERQTRLRGVLRSHRPSPGDPLIVLMVDEIASLTAYVTDRDAKKRISAALALLLSQGRAVGVCVVAAGQDARKEVLPDRGLFPNRLALRLNEPDEVDLVLGNRARDRGARADEISLDGPGIAYALADDRPEPERLRFAHIPDEQIDTICSLYEPGAPEPTDITTTSEQLDAPHRRLTAVPDSITPAEGSESDANDRMRPAA